MFETSNYLTSTIKDTERTPEETVIEYINAFTRWSKHCHYRYKEVKSLDTLKQEGARDILLKLREKYCTSLNREFIRSDAGHFYLDGATNINAEIEYISKTSKNEVEVYTKVLKSKKLLPHKFIVRKVGATWKIQDYYRRSGKNTWRKEDL